MCASFTPLDFKPRGNGNRQSANATRVCACVRLCLRKSLLNICLLLAYTCLLLVLLLLLPPAIASLAPTSAAAAATSVVVFAATVAAVACAYSSSGGILWRLYARSTLPKAIKLQAKQQAS